MHNCRVVVVAFGSNQKISLIVSFVPHKNNKQKEPRSFPKPFEGCILVRIADRAVFAILLHSRYSSIILLDFCFTFIFIFFFKVDWYCCCWCCFTVAVALAASLPTRWSLHLVAACLLLQHVVTICKQLLHLLYNIMHLCITYVRLCRCVYVHSCSRMYGSTNLHALLLFFHLFLYIGPQEGTRAKINENIIYPV